MGDASSAFRVTALGRAAYGSICLTQSLPVLRKEVSVARFAGSLEQRKGGLSDLSSRLTVTFFFIPETRKVVRHACAHRLADLPPPTESQGQCDLPCAELGGAGLRSMRAKAGRVCFITVPVVLKQSQVVLAGLELSL